LVGLLKDCSSKKLRTMKQQQDSYADYIGYDLGGYAYNKKYPPNTSAYGTHNGGYPTDNQEAFFYDLAVNLFGIKFTYGGTHYLIPSDGEDWILIDEDNNQKSDPYDNPIELIENAKVKGNRLIDIIDDLQDIVLQ
jgi:hypothetical protein